MLPTQYIKRLDVGGVVNDATKGATDAVNTVTNGATDAATTVTDAGKTATDAGKTGVEVASGAVGVSGRVVEAEHVADLREELAIYKMACP